MLRVEFSGLIVQFFGTNAEARHFSSRFVISNAVTVISIGESRSWNVER
jgi:phosphate starvation-inducible membrane PsiE